MRKGLTTQCVIVLFDRVVDVEELVTALADFETSRRTEAAENVWITGPGVLVPYRPEVNGYAAVDVVGRRWPDHLGDQAAPGVLSRNGDPDVLAAWVVGRLGPGAGEGCLARARSTSGFDGASEVAGDHTAFVRITTSYAYGAGQDDPVLPDDYEAAPELDHVLALAQAVLELPGALAYFNPCGEVLWTAETLADGRRWHVEHDAVPVPLLANARRVRLDDDWLLVDTVGMAQLDGVDQEACFLESGYDAEDVETFVRNVAEYVRVKGPVISDGDTTDGPGGVVWRARSFDDSLAVPARRTLRWFPDDGRARPD